MWFPMCDAGLNCNRFCVLLLEIVVECVLRVIELLRAHTPMPRGCKMGWVSFWLVAVQLQAEVVEGRSLEAITPYVPR